MTKRIALAEAKAHLSEIVRAIEEGGDSVVVERRGRPVAVIHAYREELDGSTRRHWAEELDGVAAGINDFESTMKAIVKSRGQARPRPVRLED